MKSLLLQIGDDRMEKTTRLVGDPAVDELVEDDPIDARGGGIPFRGPPETGTRQERAFQVGSATPAS